MLSPKAFAGKRYFVFLKPLYETTFVHSLHKGERASYEDQLVILVFVILWWRGGGVELKMHDVTHFTVFLF